MKVLVTGATGFVGRHVVKALLERGDEVRVTSRTVAGAERAFGGEVRAFAWQPSFQPCPFDALEGVDGIVHLLGEPVMGLWTAAKKTRIRDSRSLGTRFLVDGVALLPEGFRPKVLVSASATGYYGDAGDKELPETAPPGTDFLAETCAQWEKEALRAESFGVRVAMLRFGLVLGKDGGAYQAMRPAFRLGLGGRLGSGRQWWPWVHIEDAAGLVLHALANEAVKGPVNTCPAPVTNADFTAAMGQALGRPTLIPAPGFALKLALGELSSLFLYSQRTKAEVANQTRYVWQHEDLAGALAACAK